MKKVLLVLLMASLCHFSCTATKPIIDNSAVLQNHQQPYKVFGIGYWQPGYSIVTLTDASHNYFVIKTIRNDSLKVGDIYRPQL